MIKNFDIKKNYAAAWILLALTVFAAFLTGSVTALMLFVFSLVALALVYALALWTVISNTRKVTA